MKYSPLTPKQKKVLEFITSFVQKKDFSPSYEEIAKHFELKSISSVHQYISALSAKGYLEKTDFKQRSIKPILSEVEIPLLGLLTAGEAIDYLSDPQNVKVPKEMVGSSGVHFALKIKGNGWTKDDLVAGDLVVVKKQKTASSGSKIVGILPSDEVVLKRVQKTQGGYKLTPLTSGTKAISRKLSIKGKITGIVKNTSARAKQHSIVKDAAFELDRVVTGDVLDVLAQIPDNSVHLAITSPPYNVGISYDTHDDKMKYQEYLNWLENVWRETKRVLVPGGRFAINIAPTGIKNFVPIHHDFIAQQKKLGMKFRTEIIWYKQTMLKRTAWGSFKSPSNPHIIPSWEYVLIFSKEKDRLDGDPRNADITSQEFIDFSDGFWAIQPETRRNGHPAPFPKELIYRLIKFYSYKGNTVLDMFGGTGTVALVANETGRHFIHIDESKLYNEIATKRIFDVKNQMPLFNNVLGPEEKNVEFLGLDPMPE